jgi:hypothetical protein
MLIDRFQQPLYNNKGDPADSVKAKNRIAWPRPAGSKVKHCDISGSELTLKSGIT